MAFKRSSSTLGNVERKRRSDYGKKKRTWTKEELDYLSRYYGNESVSSISRALKRTKRAVRLKALQEGLRIVKPRKNSVNLKLTETVSKLNEPKGRISKSKTASINLIKGPNTKLG